MIEIVYFLFLEPQTSLKKRCQFGFSQTHWHFYSFFEAFQKKIKLKTAKAHHHLDSLWVMSNQWPINWSKIQKNPKQSSVRTSTSECNRNRKQKNNKMFSILTGKCNVSYLFIWKLMKITSSLSIFLFLFQKNKPTIQLTCTKPFNLCYNKNVFILFLLAFINYVGNYVLFVFFINAFNTMFVETID